MKKKKKKTYDSNMTSEADNYVTNINKSYMMERYKC